MPAHCQFLFSSSRICMCAHTHEILFIFPALMPLPVRIYLSRLSETSQKDEGSSDAPSKLPEAAARVRCRWVRKHPSLATLCGWAWPSAHRPPQTHSVHCIRAGRVLSVLKATRLQSYVGTAVVQSAGMLCFPPPCKVSVRCTIDRWWLVQCRERTLNNTRYHFQRM